MATLNSISNIMLLIYTFKLSIDTSN